MFSGRACQNDSQIIPVRPNWDAGEATAVSQDPGTSQTLQPFLLDLLDAVSPSAGLSLWPLQTLCWLSPVAVLPTPHIRGWKEEAELSCQQSWVSLLLLRVRSCFPPSHTPSNQHPWSKREHPQHSGVLCTHVSLIVFLLQVLLTCSLGLPGWSPWGAFTKHRVGSPASAYSWLLGTLGRTWGPHHSAGDEGLSLQSTLATCVNSAGKVCKDILRHLHEGDQSRHGLTGQGVAQIAQLTDPPSNHQSYTGQRLGKSLSNLSLKVS